MSELYDILFQEDSTSQRRVACGGDVRVGGVVADDEGFISGYGGDSYGFFRHSSWLSTLRKTQMTSPLSFFS